MEKMPQRIATRRRTHAALTIDFVSVFPPEHSLRNGGTAYTRSPRCPGLIATVACRSSNKLDPSVGRSGPHDFAVRFELIRRRFSRPSRNVHRILHPTSVTIAKRPSCGCGTAALYAQVLIFVKRNFCIGAADYADQLESFHKNSRLAQANLNLRPFGTRECGEIRKIEQLICPTGLASGRLAQRPCEAELMAVGISQMEIALTPFGVAGCGGGPVAGSQRTLMTSIDVIDVEDDAAPP